LRLIDLSFERFHTDRDFFRSSSASRATPWKRPAEELAADMRALFEQLLAPEQSK